jgi:hypothetical protein
MYHGGRLNVKFAVVVVMVGKHFLVAPDVNIHILQSPVPIAAKLDTRDKYLLSFCTECFCTRVLGRVAGYIVRVSSLRACVP